MWEEKSLLNTSGIMGKWILQYITGVSAFLSQITAYREKNIQMHLQAQRDLLALMFEFNHQNYSQYLTTHHVELTNLFPSKTLLHIKTFKPMVSGLVSVAKGFPRYQEI